MSAAPIWFGPEGRPLFGWVHTPASGYARAGVVICPTLAHENEAVHATLRHLAQGLAERGFCALRLDYDGTGDSAGRQQGPGRVAAWLSSVTEAIALLRNGGVRSVMVVGVRFGALMAALAAEQDGHIEGWSFGTRSFRGVPTWPNSGC